MPAKKQDKILLTCPHCGHQQQEPRAVISTVCKSCTQHFRADEVAKPSAKAKAKVPERPKELKHLTCFECGTQLEAAASAQSTMCKRCSAHIDLRDYSITNAVSKNFKTKGRFVIELKGYVFNTEATAGDAVIKGKFLGKLFAEHSLTIYSTADIKGTFQTGKLIIPAENHFRWKEDIKVGSAEIAGELAGNLRSEGTVALKPTARLFGNVQARNLIVEEGAVFVGKAQIGTEPRAPAQTTTSTDKPAATRPQRKRIP
jgi:cytoskeletal protein CcmA (bactofilin family)/DNA-directed RNA polymerase subunit RPC12/RpoP